MNLTPYIAQRRWFRGKARGLREARIDEVFPLELGGEPVDLAIVECTYESGEPDRYVLPIATAIGPEAESLKPHLVIGVEKGKTRYDALGSEKLLAGLLEKLRGGGTRIDGPRGTLVFRPLPGFDDVPHTSVAPKATEKEQTNSSIVFGDAYIFKIVRKLDEGRSAELEMGETLTRHGYASIPQVLGAIEIVRKGGGEPSTIGVVHRFLANEGDAWAYTLETVARDPAPAAYRDDARLLGTRLGEMHAVLASATERDFAATTLDRAARTAIGAAVTANARSVAGSLRPGDEAKIAARVAAFVELPKDPLAMRVHGDLHLGQILAAQKDFVFIDFEGEPARSIEERKARRSPLADVAGMLRSFDYAAATVLRGVSVAEANAWYAFAAEAFLAAYRSAAPAAITDPATWRACLDFYLVEKCLYEIAYEANNRPDWLAIPRDGLGALLDSEPTK